MNRRRPNGRACRVGGRPGFRAFPAPAACPAAARGRHRRRQHRTPAGPRLAPAPVPGRFVGRPCHSASRRDSGPTTRSGGQNRTRFPRNWPVNNAQPRVTMGSATAPPLRVTRSWSAPLPRSGGRRHRQETLPCGFGNMRHGTDDLRERREGDFREGCGRKTPGATGSISAGGRRHRIANVVSEGRAPTGRIRRGDPAERHGLLRPGGHTVTRRCWIARPPAAG